MLELYFVGSILAHIHPVHWRWKSFCRTFWGCKNMFFGDGRTHFVGLQSSKPQPACCLILANFGSINHGLCVLSFPAMPPPPGCPSICLASRCVAKVAQPTWDPQRHCYCHLVMNSWYILRWSASSFKMFGHLNALMFSWYVLVELRDNLRDSRPGTSLVSQYLLGHVAWMNNLQAWWTCCNKRCVSTFFTIWHDFGCGFLFFFPPRETRQWLLIHGISRAKKKQKIELWLQL